MIDRQMKGKNMKVIAFYLPQFHEIKENNEWWGEGFTEWVNVKKATPLFDGHRQPRVPLNDNYYNLLDDSVKEWQIKIAKENGIYGFCMYHYWFNGRLLLEKPVEQFLNNRDLDMPFCLCWANENWTTQWVDSQSKILLEQRYGDREDWKNHFEYFLPYFKDDRYIKEDNCPLLVIYKPDIIDSLEEMLDYWNELAIQNGFSGIRYANQYSNVEDIKEGESKISYHIEYQPIFANRWKKKQSVSKFRNVTRKIKKMMNVVFPWKDWTGIAFANLDYKSSYDEAWQTILNHKPQSEKAIAGAFVDWDNTPRKGKRGTIYLGASPIQFKKYFSQLTAKVKKEYSNDYIFVFAWNEWGEGGYLEPDKDYGYGYLNAIRDVVEKDRERD